MTKENIKSKREQIRNLLDAIAKSQAIVDGLKAELEEMEKEEVIPRLHKAVNEFRKKHYGEQPQGLIVSYENAHQIFQELSKNPIAGSYHDNTVFGLKILPCPTIEKGLVAFITETYDL